MEPVDMRNNLSANDQEEPYPNLSTDNPDPDIPDEAIASTSGHNPSKQTLDNKGQRICSPKNLLTNKTRPKCSTAT